MVIKPQDKRIWRPEGGLARKIDYESFTSISKYAVCPVVYHKHYDNYFREPVGPPALVGRAVHETIAAILRETMLRGVDMPPDIVDTIYPVLWEVELSLAKNQPGGIQWDATPSPEQMKEKGRLLIRHWMQEIYKTIVPKAVEEPFSVRMKDVKQFLYGRFDLITPTGFWDHKTSMKNVDVDKDSLRLQMGIYYIGFLDKYKQWPEEVYITELRTTGELRAEALPYRLSKSEVQQIINERIKPAMRGIVADKERGIWECTCGHHKTVEANPIDRPKSSETIRSSQATV